MYALSLWIRKNIVLPRLCILIRYGRRAVYKEEASEIKKAPVYQSEGSPAPSEDYESYDAYAEKLAGNAKNATGEFIGHLIPFVTVNGFLMILNATVSPGFPWALFPLGGWGIGLLEHFAGMLRTKNTYKELNALPVLNGERLSIFKRLQKKKDEFWHSLAGLIPTSAFLLMINLITSRGFLWSLIPIFFMSTGFFSKAVAYSSETAALKRALKESLRENSGAFRTKKYSQTAVPGPYAALVTEADSIREAIVQMVQRPSAQNKQKKERNSGVPEADELVPVLNAYVEQVQLLADRTGEVDRIIELIPKAALMRDKELLEQKMKEQSKTELQKEYAKAFSELERQETSFNELREQRDLLELKLRSSVNNLKQMQIDIGRIISLTGSGESGAERSLQYKAEELSRYLEDLRSGYEEVAGLENRAGNLSDLEGEAP